jgi:hypothetical protein
MMNSRALLTTRIAVLVLLLLSTGTVARAEWNSASSTTFTLCSVAATCLGAPLCSGSTLGIGEGCYEICGDSVPGTECGATSHTWSEIGWYTTGGGFAGNGGTYDDLLPPTNSDLTVSGNRLSDELFVVDVLHQTSGEGFFRAEVSLVRFDGDPLAFSGLHVTGVDQLVTLGLIGENDILFFAEAADFTTPSQFEVDVTGLPDEELVLFVIEEGISIPTPATSLWGHVTILALLLAAGASILARRH